MTIKLLSVVGARPQFVKLAPLCRAIGAFSKDHSPITHDIIHTGQHYDDAMSESFFRELELPAATVNLGVGSGLHGEQTAQMLTGIEQVLLDKKPDMVLVYGDTNSTVAAALAAAKLHIPIAHIEAGLRSFNRKMPEELNRIATDHLSDLLLAPTATAMHNLSAENLADRALLTGDIMRDAVIHNRQLAAKSSIVERLGLQPKAYAVVTVHRAENTDNERLALLSKALKLIGRDLIPLVFPMHPRTLSRPDAPISSAGLQVLPPQGYLDMLSLLDNAALVLTDSGGVQKEAFFLDVPCITMRDETEWSETIDCGANELVGADPDKLVAAVRRRLDAGQKKPNYKAMADSAFGEGDAGEQILRGALEHLGVSFDLAAAPQIN